MCWSGLLDKGLYMGCALREELVDTLNGSPLKAELDSVRVCVGGSEGV